MREIGLESLGEALPSTRLLLTVGDAALPETLAAQLQSWVEAGGRWIAIAGSTQALPLVGQSVLALHETNVHCPFASHCPLSQSVA